VLTSGVRHEVRKPHGAGFKWQSHARSGVNDVQCQQVLKEERQAREAHSMPVHACWSLQVWDVDTQNPAAKPPGGGESVEDVAERVRALFRRLEAGHAGATLLLVAHGDLLSVLWAVVVGIPLREHRRHAFSPGELRLLPIACHLS